MNVRVLPIAKKDKLVQLSSKERLARLENVLNTLINETLKRESSIQERLLKQGRASDALERIHLTHSKINAIKGMI